MQRILTALDDSESSALVLRRAIDLVTACGGRLRLLRALPTLAEEATVASANRHLVDAEADLARASGSVPAAARDGIWIERGEPWKVICNAARQWNPDVVVVGAHRHGIIARAVGTTASRVVDHARCPVYVVPRDLASSADADEVEALRGPSSGLVHEACAQRTRARASVGAPPGMPFDAETPTAGRELAPGRLRVERVHVALPAAADLRADHAHLEHAYRDLLAAYERNDWRGVVAAWSVFEPCLRAQMDHEESTSFSVLRALDPLETSTLEEQHRDLRQMLDILGVGIELQCVPRTDVLVLQATLREHAARDERVFYPWLVALGSNKPALA